MRAIIYKEKVSQIITHIRTIALTFLVGAFICFSGTNLAGTLKQATQRNEPEIEAVIFDLGGVLIETSKMTIIREIGLLTLLKYIFTLHNPKLMQEKLFEILSQVEPLDPNGPGALTPDGKQQLPQPLRNWLADVV